MKRLVVLLMFLIAVPVCAIEVGVLDRPAGLYAVLADTDPLLAILTYSPLSSPVIYLARMGGFGGQGTVGAEGLVAGVATASSGSAGALGGYGLITYNGLVLAARSLSGQGGSAVAGTFTASGTHVVLFTLGGQGGTATMGTLAITAGSSSSVARALVGLGASGGVFGSSELLTSFDIPMDGLGGSADVGALAAVGGSASLGAVLVGSGAAGGYGVLTVSTTGNGIAAALGRGASAGYGVITASGLVFGTASPDGQGSAGSTGTVGAAIGVVNGFAALGGTGATGSYGTITGAGFGLGAASLSGKGGAGSGGTVSSAALRIVNTVLTGGGAAGGYGLIGTTVVVVANPTLLNFENGYIDSKSATWSFVSGPNGGYGTDATGAIGAYGAGTYHSSSHSFKLIQGLWSDGEATDVTAGDLVVASAATGAGKVSLWVKGIGGPVHVFGSRDGAVTFDFAPSGESVAGEAPADTWTKMVSLDTIPAGTHSFDIGIYINNGVEGAIAYIDDVELP